MFAVIKRLNGTRHNMRHESQWFWDVTFRKRAEIPLIFSLFLSLTDKKKKKPHSPRTLHTNTHTLRQFRRGTLTVFGHLAVMAGSETNRDADRGESATSRHYTHIPGSQTRGRDRRGSLTWKRGWRAAGSLECVKRGNCRRQSVRPLREQREGENETDKSREDSEMPAVSPSSSSSFSPV